MRARGTLRPRRTFSRNGITSSERSGPPKETRMTASYCKSVHAAHARGAAASAGAGGHLGALASPGNLGGKGGVLLRQMLLPAGGAFDGAGVGSAAHQLLKLRPAIVTTV